MSTHNICFPGETQKSVQTTLLSRAMETSAQNCQTGQVPSSCTCIFAGTCLVISKPIEIFFLYLKQSICCGYSKDRDDSFEHPKHD